MYPPTQHSSPSHGAATAALPLRQAARPRGLIPLVPKSFSSAIEAVSHDMQKGATFKHYLQVNVSEPGSYQDIVASYVITENDETLIEGRWRLTQHTTPPHASP